MSTVNTSKLLRELQRANLPVWGCNSDGVVFWDAAPTADQLTAAERIVRNHNPQEPLVPSIEDRVRAVEDAMLSLLLTIQSS